MVYGRTSLGQVSLDKSGCASCPATFATPSRYPTFALASDTPFPINLSGRIDVNCTDGSRYDVFLSSPMRGGVFQTIPNLCVNYDSKSLKLAITTVGLSDPDKDRTVTLTALGILR